MAKQGGMGDNFYAAGYNVSGDVQQIPRIGGGPAPYVVTAINVYAQERIGGKFDGSMGWSTFFNPAAGASHERFSALPTTNQVLTYCRGTLLGSPAAALVAKQIGHDGNRAQDGGFSFSIEGQAADGTGLEWGRQGTAGVRTDTEATDGASIDDGAPTAFGLSAYLHVFALTGDDLTVKLQESDDDGDVDSWADVAGGAFTEATGITSQRIATAPDLAVEQYLRVVTTGTFSSASFAVLISRHETEPLW